MAWDLQTMLGQLHTQDRHAITHISTHSTTSAYPIHTIPSLCITIIELLGRSACVHTFFLSTAVMTAMEESSLRWSTSKSAILKGSSLHDRGLWSNMRLWRRRGRGREGREREMEGEQKRKGRGGIGCENGRGNVGR